MDRAVPEDGRLAPTAPGHLLPTEVIVGGGPAATKVFVIGVATATDELVVVSHWAADPSSRGQTVHFNA